jgi:hypothetical protein
MKALMILTALILSLSSCSGGGGVPDPDPTPQTGAVEIAFGNPTDTAYLIRAVNAQGQEVWQAEIASQSTLPATLPGQQTQTYLTVATVTGAEKIRIEVAPATNPDLVLWTAQYGKGRRTVDLTFAFGV